MNKLYVLVVFLCLISLYGMPSLAKDPITAKVDRVIDGDTIVLESGEKVRLIGIDCPELHDPKRNERNAKKLGVAPDLYQSYAGKSKEFLEGLVGNLEVELYFDDTNEKIDHKDRYGRTLSYIRGLYGDPCYALVWNGYCTVYRRFQFRKKEKYIELEKEAKEKGKGIWGE